MKSALGEKNAGCGSWREQGREGFLIRCEGDEGRRESRGRTAGSVLCLFKEQRSIQCGWTAVVREGCKT